MEFGLGNLIRELENLLLLSRKAPLGGEPRLLRPLTLLESLLPPRSEEPAQSLWASLVGISGASENSEHVRPRRSSPVKALLLLGELELRRLTEQALSLAAALTVQAVGFGTALTELAVNLAGALAQQAEQLAADNLGQDPHDIGPNDAPLPAGPLALSSAAFGSAELVRLLGLAAGRGSNSRRAASAVAHLIGGRAGAVAGSAVAGAIFGAKGAGFGIAGLGHFGGALLGAGLVGGLAALTLFALPKLFGHGLSPAERAKQIEQILNANRFRPPTHMDKEFGVGAQGLGELDYGFGEQPRVLSTPAVAFEDRGEAIRQWVRENGHEIATSVRRAMIEMSPLTSLVREFS